jgi:phage regulator Rha-like protein
MEIIRLEDVENRIIEIREQKVMLDSDVAELYGVETRDVNKAVKNNPDKFPSDYIFKLDKADLEVLRWKFSTAKLTKTRVSPKAFTEKGLYMLATILKSKRAVQTTIAIIEAFSRIRNLSRNIKELSAIRDESQKQGLLQKSGGIIAEIFDDDLLINETQTSIELLCGFEVQAHDKEEERSLKNAQFCPRTRKAIILTAGTETASPIPIACCGKLQFFYFLFPMYDLRYTALSLFTRHRRLLFPLPFIGRLTI